MSMYRVVSCIVEIGCFMWPVYSLDKTLLTFALLHFVLQGQTCLLFQVSLDFQLLHSSPLWWKGNLFLVLVLEGLVGLHGIIQLQPLQHQWLGHKLGILWCWMVCLGNDQGHSVVFEIACKYYISDSLVGYEGFCISSKRFLPTAVDIRVIWIKFTHSHPL